MKNHVCVLTFLWLGLLLLPGAHAGVPQANTSQQPTIIYDAKDDKLTLEAKQSSLTDILGRVAMLTGAEVLMDAEAETLTSISLKNEPLENALKQLLRDLNYAMFYDEKQSESGPQTLLVGIRILPAGKHDNSNLKPIAMLEAEAFRHVREANTRLPSALDLSSERWQARLNKMPEKQREKLIALAVERFKAWDSRKAKSKARRDERKAEREKRRQEQLAKRQARLDRLKETNPEAYALIIQQREEIRRQVEAELRNAQTNEEL